MKETMTLNLTTKEMEILTKLAKEKGISKTALIRQALRLYQSIDAKIQEGEQIFINNPILDKKTRLMIV